MSADLDRLTMLHAFAEQEPSDSSERFDEFAVAVFEEWDEINTEIHLLRRTRYLERTFPIYRSQLVDGALDGRQVEDAPPGRLRAPKVADAGAIPLDMLLTHHRRIWLNHHVSLNSPHLREGLSECEAVAVLEDRPWVSMQPEAARARLDELVRAWTEDQLRSEIARLKQEIYDARVRMLTIADYDDVDAGEKTLSECVSLVELDLNAEFELRIELEEKLAGRKS